MIDGYEDQLRAFLDENGFEDWDCDDSTLTCAEHCHTIEHDGICPEGCVSPLRELGMI